MKFIPSSALDKLRLLILYIVAQEGIQDSDRRRLLEVSKLNPEDSQAITNLSHMGVRLTAASNKSSKNNAVRLRSGIVHGITFYNYPICKEQVLVLWTSC
jgi:hypothetical protein